MACPGWDMCCAGCAVAAAQVTRGSCSCRSPPGRHAPTLFQSQRLRCCSLRCCCKCIRYEAKVDEAPQGEFEDLKDAVSCNSVWGTINLRQCVATSQADFAHWKGSPASVSLVNSQPCQAVVVMSCWVPLLLAECCAQFLRLDHLPEPRALLQASRVLCRCPPQPLVY
jgi:hypothetical protein